MAIRTRKNVGPSGLADVRVLTKGVRITMEDGNVYDLPPEGIDAGRKSGKYNVRLSADKSKAYLSAPGGMYTLAFYRMGNRTNDIPQTKITEARIAVRKSDGQPFPIDREHIFIAQFEIRSEGIYKGLLTTANLPFAFSSPLVGNNCDFYDSKRNLRRLDTFFSVAGGVSLAEIEIPYKPDPSAILLWVESLLQQRNRVFLGTLNEAGFLDIDSLSNIPADLLPKTTKKGKK